MYDNESEIKKDQKEWKINVLNKKDILEGIARDANEKIVIKDTLIEILTNIIQ